MYYYEIKNVKKKQNKLQFKYYLNLGNKQCL